MLLLTVVYDQKVKDFCEDINEIKNLFELRNIQIGLSERNEKDEHFIKIFCEDINSNEELVELKNTFYLYFSEFLYKMLVDSFCKESLIDFLEDRYFFLKSSDITSIMKLSEEVLLNDSIGMNLQLINCINIKNNALKEIIECLKETEEININGFLTFRSKELSKGFMEITNIVVEKFLEDKEYTEFIKLLRFFVDVQECVFDEINLIIESNGNYLLKNKNGEDIMDMFLEGLSDVRYSGTVNIEDVIISGLITHVPKRIVIHCFENCTNQSFINTIKDVFLERAHFCDECSFCTEYIVHAKH